jgi:hypothetical protein
MTSGSTDRDIETARFSSWDDIVGNYYLKRHLHAMVKSIAGPSKGQGVNTGITGGSRTGKTASAEFAIAAMLCRDVQKDTWTPCGKCELCLQNAARDHHVLLEVYRWGGDERDLQFVPIDGNNATASDIDRALAWSAGQEGRWLYYIDEIQGLVRRNLDEALYKAVEQRRHITWIITTATTKGLDKMLWNRFTEVSTELPSVQELALYLARRCRHYGITWDEDETILRLAVRSGQIVGKALKVLAMAKMFGGTLSGDIVDHYVFDREM